MSDVVLSASVRQNLLSLQSTADLLATTQTRLATGKKVNTALDNPTNFFTAASLDARASDINNLLDGIFYARLVCMKNGELYEIDSRTSDAIAMAVRFECPIYTYDFILEAAGVVLEEQDEEGGGIGTSKMPANLDSDALETLSIEALQRRLQEVLEAEDYETAAKIRDELKRREAKD